MGRKHRQSPAQRHVWRRALRAFDRVFTSASAKLEVHEVKSCGSGLYRRGFGAFIELTPDPDARAGPYVALVPWAEVEADPGFAETIAREAAVLEQVARSTSKLRVPTVAGIVDRTILVEGFVRGIEVDLRAGRLPIVPWDLIAEAASCIHTVEPPACLPARTIGEHRAATLEQLALPLRPPPPITAALAWMREQLDDPRPGVLLHGDLLGHNLRLDPTDVLGVIDWMSAEVGDPGYELAIVTRGARRPPGGSRDALLDAYNAHAERPTDHDALRFFELALLLHWYATPEDGADLSEPTLAKIRRRLPS